jgi:hypothetical protein
MQDDVKLICLLGAIVVAGVAIIGAQDVRDHEEADRLYCEMVAIHDSSNGEYGWPAYRGQGVCNDT